MLKKIIMLFKLGRKISKSGAVHLISNLYNPPLIIKILLSILGFSFDKQKYKIKKSPEEDLCRSLQEMGTTFIKLGQFLATRPDIVGETLAKNLETLQDKLPAFENETALSLLKEELGEKNFKNIIHFSKPIAAASIAQVHIATILEENGTKKEVAIKILRPNIEKTFNEELDALMLLAFYC